MLAVNCLIGRTSESLEVPNSFELGGDSFGDIFNAIAETSSGEPLLTLSFDSSRLDKAFVKDHNPIDAFWLHEALRELTRIGPTDKGLRDDIGLIFAHRWEGSASVFGMMFDIGFTAKELGSVDTYQEVAREGCAVFLDAIRDFRKEEDFKDEDIDRQILWTTLHELGHVFNLWHIENPVRFVTPSKKGEIYTPDPTDSTNGIAYAYHDKHRNFLINCLSEGRDGENAKYAWPGGSPFGVRDKNGAYDYDYYRSHDAPISRSALELVIAINQEEFWSFEPIELDIQVRVPSSIKKHYSLPDQIDPGYSSFNIWIEEPDGCRRPYRSPRIYCENPGTVPVHADQPFARDLSIFGESGGYTFRKVGPHRLYATWLLPGGRVLESNRVEIEAKPWNLRWREFIDRRDVLTEPEAALLLYHREGRYRNRIVEPIEDLAIRTDDRRLEANLRYAVGRYLYRAGEGRSRATREKHFDRAANHLAETLDMEDVLSRRRKHHAARIVDEIQQS